MKIFNLILIAFLSCSSAFSQQVTNNTSPFNGSDSIRISGKIAGFNSRQPDSFISFSSYDVTGEGKRYSFQVHDDGTYQAIIFQPFSGDIQLIYHDVFINLYAIPGKNLSVNINQDKILKSTNNKGAFTSYGNLAQLNSLMFKYQEQFNPDQYSIMADFGNKTQTDSIYAQKRITQMFAERRFLDSFITRNKVKDQLFIQWQKDYITYHAATNIVLFPFFGRLNKKITDVQLVSLLHNIPLNSKTAVNTSVYYTFLHTLAISEQIIINVNPFYDTLKKINGYNPVPLYLKKLSDKTAGLSEQLLFVDTYPANPKAARLANKVWDKFIAVVTDPYLKTVLLSKRQMVAEPFKPYNLIERLQDAKVNDTLKQKLIAIFDKEKGNNVYLDFWFDGCGACMMELPNYPKFMALLKDKPIKFILFSAYTSSQRMEAVKQQNHIDADFINLSKNEIAVLNNAFEFNSYPSHFLIDKNGMIVNNTFSGLYNDESIKNSLSILNSLGLW